MCDLFEDDYKEFVLGELAVISNRHFDSFKVMYKICHSAVV